MPELPEVEHLRRSLESDLIGLRVETVSVFRADVVAIPDGSRGPIAHELLEGATVASLERRGKQLAIVDRDDRGVVVQLGMSGQVLWRDSAVEPGAGKHVHVRWRFRDRLGGIRHLEFRDPRRFGGLSPFRSRDDLESRLWTRLGRDAAESSTDDLATTLVAASAGSRRPVKSMLLDQSVIAGIGNIYADEALFAAGIDPRHRAERLHARASLRLAGEIKATMARAIAAGGSTLRDYVDALGRSGSFQRLHRVYGRGGQPCLSCQEPLKQGLVAGRTTVWCRRCQASRSRRSCT